jgi:hydrogenase nickel incorporation protein HypA/HybF
MHELSIALSLIDAAAEEADRRGGLTVRVIHLRLGTLSGVEAGALASAFELAIGGSAIDGAELVIESVPVIVFCPSCRAERALPTLQRFACPACDAPTPTVVRGKELEITALEVDP